MSRAGRMRDAMVRRMLGVDPKAIARGVAKTRRAVDEEASAAATSRLSIESRIGVVVRAVDELDDKVARVDDQVNGIHQLGESLSTLTTGLTDIRAALSAVEAGVARVESGVLARLTRLEAGIGGVRGLAESARDDIPRLQRGLAAARGAADYETAFDDPDPLVSVRIAAYQNTEALVERAIASVLRQTHQNLEILVVNDGPNAQTRTAIEAVGDHRIRYVEFPFRRLYPDQPDHRWMVAGSPGMNEGARQAAGSWIAPLDDDDEFAVDHIERLLALARVERAELAYGALDRFDETSGDHERIFAFPPRRGGFTFQGAIYHAGLRFFEYDEESWRVGEPGDWNLCRRMLAAGVRIAATETVVGTMYRIPFSDKADDTPPKRA